MPKTISGRVAMPDQANPQALTVEVHRADASPGDPPVATGKVNADGTFSLDVDDAHADHEHADAQALATHHPRVAGIFGLHDASSKLSGLLGDLKSASTAALEGARDKVDALRDDVADFIATAPHVAARAEGRTETGANLVVKVAHPDDEAGPSQSHPVALGAGTQKLDLGDLGEAHPTAAPGKWAYDPAWKLPRRKWGVQKLDDPTFDDGWNAAYLGMLVNTNSPTVKKPYGFFVGNFLEKSELGPYWSFKLDVMTNPSVGTIFETAADAQAAFPVNLTLAEKKKTGQAFVDDAFVVRRLLQGMYSPYFKSSEAGDTETLTMELAWGAYEQETGDIKLNDVTAALTRPKGSSATPTLASITVAGDTFEPSGQTATWDRWNWAKYQLMVSVLLRGELDAHLTHGHLVVEQYLLPTMIHLSEDNPARQVLAPHVRDVWGINNFGNPLIFGKTGVLAKCSALTEAGVTKRLEDALAGMDWKGFKPRSPICDEHFFARAAGIYWSAVVDHVEKWFDAHWATASGADQARWQQELTAYGLGLVEHALPAVPTEAGDGWRDTNEFAKPVGSDGKAVSKLDGGNLDDVKQLCAYVVFHATFAHDWANDRQQDDGGDVEFASFGLRDAKPATGDWSAWWKQAQPSSSSATFQLFLAQVLTNIRWGYVVGAPAMQAKEKADHVEHHEEAQIQALIDVLEAGGESSPAAQLAPLGLPIDNLRARINT